MIRLFSALFSGSIDTLPDTETAPIVAEVAASIARDDGYCNMPCDCCKVR